ncbi:cytolysin [Schizophyllum commune]
MSQRKTTWEDLARLGWPIYDVYRKANAARGGTMNGTGDLSLNSGIAARYQWWCYNTTIGRPYIIGRNPRSFNRETVAWSYDNTHNNEEHKEDWTETWTNTNSATLTISNNVSISLNGSITIANVASSGLQISVSLDSSTTQSAQRTYNLNRSWSMRVGPGEKLTLYRITTTVSEFVEYGQDFGITDRSLLGTEGEKYAGHYYWGMNVNALCNRPRGRLNLYGTSERVTYAFKLVRKNAGGREVVTSFAVDAYQADDASAASMEEEDPWAKDSKAVYGDGVAQIMVAAPGDE